MADVIRNPAPAGMARNGVSMGAVTMVALAVAGYFWGALTWSYASGERAGWIQKFAKKYASSRKPTMAGLLKDLHGLIERLNERRTKRGMGLLARPSRKAFERAVKALDPFEVEAGRTSPEAARKKFYIVRGGLEVTRPFERLELDEDRAELRQEGADGDDRSEEPLQPISEGRGLVGDVSRVVGWRRLDLLCRPPRILRVHGSMVHLRELDVQ